MSERLLAEGMLTWGRGERIGDRYGLVAIQERGYGEWHEQDATTRYFGEARASDYAGFKDVPTGTRGTLVAEVVETRESGHIGDLFHGFQPVTPEVGERITLGKGTLFTEQAWDGVQGVGLRPDDDRDTFWLDPPSLYRAHEQTVRLIFEEEVIA